MFNLSTRTQFRKGWLGSPSQPSFFLGCFFWGGSFYRGSYKNYLFLGIKPCKYIVILKELPYKSACFGLVILYGCQVCFKKMGAVTSWPWLFVVIYGIMVYPVEDYFISHEMRIPWTNQDDSWFMSGFVAVEPLCKKNGLLLPWMMKGPIFRERQATKWRLPVEFSWPQGACGQN